MEAKTTELAELEAGQEVTLTLAHPDGGESSYDVTVDFNTIGAPDDHMFGLEKLRAYTSKKRTAIEVTVRANGVARAKPRYNANGRGEDGVVVGVER